MVRVTARGRIELGRQTRIAVTLHPRTSASEHVSLSCTGVRKTRSVFSPLRKNLRFSSNHCRSKIRKSEISSKVDRFGSWRARSQNPQTDEYKPLRRPIDRRRKTKSFNRRRQFLPSIGNIHAIVSILISKKRRNTESRFQTKLASYAIASWEASEATTIGTRSLESKEGYAERGVRRSWWWKYKARRVAGLGQSVNGNPRLRTPRP